MREHFEVSVLCEGVRAARKSFQFLHPVTLLPSSSLSNTPSFNHVHAQKTLDTFSSFSLVKSQNISFSALHTCTQAHTHPLTIDSESIRTTQMKCDQDINKALNIKVFASSDVMPLFEFVLLSVFSYLLLLNCCRNLNPKDLASKPEREADYSFTGRELS